MKPSVTRRTNPDRPSLFDSRGWLDKVSNSPLDDYLNFCRAIEDSGVNDIENEGQCLLSIAAGFEDESWTKY